LTWHKSTTDYYFQPYIQTFYSVVLYIVTWNRYKWQCFLGNKTFFKYCK